ncbi:OLC1v1035056C1 [Oldenlandia corymbosa var. corymbosa]|uniref:OLC1v1035056C1 n=1 Tax=Oldenlandia corymbosa var. corymbosa TaxID=529605 RepID=A0AAV1CVB0_OLDCO|nr:OLC1v1035056C1 [Oldenlandia corymbosa var. corymbosa]
MAQLVHGCKPFDELSGLSPKPKTPLSDSLNHFLEHFDGNLPLTLLNMFHQEQEALLEYHRRRKEWIEEHQRQRLHPSVSRVKKRSRWCTSRELKARGQNSTQAFLITREEPEKASEAVKVGEQLKPGSSQDEDEDDQPQKKSAVECPSENVVSALPDDLLLAAGDPQQAVMNGGQNGEVPGSSSTLDRRHDQGTLWNGLRLDFDLPPPVAHDDLPREHLESSPEVKINMPKDETDQSNCRRPSWLLSKIKSLFGSISGEKKTEDVVPSTIQQENGQSSPEMENDDEESQLSNSNSTTSDQASSSTNIIGPEIRQTETNDSSRRSNLMTPSECLFAAAVAICGISGQSMFNLTAPILNDSVSKRCCATALAIGFFGSFWGMFVCRKRNQARFLTKIGATGLLSAVGIVWVMAFAKDLNFNDKVGLIIVVCLVNSVMVAMAPL